MPPHDGAGGGVPRPRKVRPASTTTAIDAVTTSWMTIGPSTFGSTVRTIVSAVLAPIPRAASTKSRSRMASVATRVSRANSGTAPIPMARTRLSRPGPSTTIMTSARRIPGTASSRSTRRMAIASTHRPR
jgi:hypothetical protein